MSTLTCPADQQCQLEQQIRTKQHAAVYDVTEIMLDHPDVFATAQQICGPGYCKKGTNGATSINWTGVLQYLGSVALQYLTGIPINWEVVIAGLWALVEPVPTPAPAS